MQIPTPQLADPDRLALIVVGVQRGFDDAEHWDPARTPSASRTSPPSSRGGARTSDPVVFVRHDSTTPGSPLQPGQAGNAFKDVVTGAPDLLVTKHVNSCFHGQPDLDQWLRDRELLGSVVTGITTNHCYETTARVGANLGHHVVLALDATHTFDRRAPDGTVVSADRLALVTAANLHGEFATVTNTKQLL